MTARTYAAIGCSPARDYQFLAPLTALIWRERIGVEPIVFLTGGWGETEQGRTALRAMTEHGIRVEHCTKTSPIGEVTLAQHVRFHAAALEDLKPDEWLMPTDADLWPIRKSYYEQHHTTMKRVVCYYANGDNYQTFPACHVAMRIREWREIYGLEVGAPLEPQIEATISSWLPSYRRRWPWTDSNFALWMSDQAIITERLQSQAWYPADVLMIERGGHPPTDRLDRSDWPTAYDVTRFVDAHLLRPFDQDRNWLRTLELFATLLPERRAWAEHYHDAYVSADRQA